jgi:hypothetical protein
MSEQLQLRRGAAASLATFTPAAGEPIVDTTYNRLMIGDGLTVGGWAAGREQRVAVSDAAYAALGTDRIVAFAALTAPRVVTLPAASAYPPGARLIVADETGLCSTALTITIARGGSDTIDGQASFAVNSAFGFVELESNGSNAWTIVGSLNTVAVSPSGAMIQFAVLETLISGLAGAAVTGPSIPANCIVFSVGARVTTAIAGAAAWEIGPSGNLSQFGGSLGVALGTTNYGLIGPTAFYSATPLLLTATSGSFTAGAVRLSIHLAFMTPSAS